MHKKVEIWIDCILVPWRYALVQMIELALHMEPKMNALIGFIGGIIAL
jgi:hypothetical protein